MRLLAPVDGGSARRCLRPPSGTRYCPRLAHDTEEPLPIWKEPWRGRRGRTLQPPEGCTNSVPSCCRPVILVQQPAKAISPIHPCAHGRWRPLKLSLLRGVQLQRTMRTLPVVVANVGPEDALEVATGEDEQPVEALGPKGSDSSLTESIGTRCP